jgi:hypothetical protein
MNLVLISGCAGIVASGLIIFLSHFASWFGVEMSFDPDRARFLGRYVSKRESHTVGIVVHALLYAAFGMMFGALVMNAVATFEPFPLAIYALGVTCFLGGVIAPLEGHGIFGWKEDHWFGADLLLMNVVWAALFGIIMFVIG